MKVKFFYQHFWPDSPPYANMLRALGAALVSAGHDVSVLTRPPSYRVEDRQTEVTRFEIVDGVAVSRMNRLPGESRHPVRLLAKILFPVRASLRIIYEKIRYRKAPDVIVAATIPPVINGLFGLLAARATGARFIYHCQDIYPEVGTTAGLWKPTSLRYRVLHWLDFQVCRRADQNVVLSQDMKESLMQRGVPAAQIAVINNFMLQSFNADKTGTNLPERSGSPRSVSATEELLDASAIRRFVFAGNFGRFQQLDILLKGFLRYKESTRSSHELHFIGSGSEQGKLESLADGRSDVVFTPFMPFESLVALLPEYDAGIVSLERDVYRYAFPSKSLTYWGIGLPVMALVEADSELARLVETEALGVVAAEAEVDVVAAAFASLVSFLDLNPQAGRHVEAYFRSSHTLEKTLDQWLSLLDSVGRQLPRAEQSRYPH